MADSDSKAAAPPKPVHIGGESLVDRILPHMKKIIIFFVLLAVAITAIMAVRWWKEHKREAETGKLAAVLQVADRPVVAPPAAGSGSAPAPAPDSKEPTFASREERAKTVLAEIAKQGTDLPGPAYRAGLLLDAGKIDDAIAEYRKGSTEAGLEGVLSREGLGIALESKAAAETDPAARQKLLEEALAAFTKMQPDAAGPRHVYALYHEARLNYALNKKAEAKALFEKAQPLAAGLDIEDLIEKRLAALGAT